MYINNNQYSPSFGAGKIKYMGDWTADLQNSFENCPYIKKSLAKNNIIARCRSFETNPFDPRYNESFYDFIDIKVEAGSSIISKVLNRFKKWQPITNKPHSTKTLIERLLKGTILQSAIDKLVSTKK